MGGHHEAIEEFRKLGKGIERQNMRYVLIRSYDDHAAPVSINAPHVENVIAALQVGAEYLFVIDKPVAALSRQEERGHRFDRKLAMALLEDGQHFDHRVDIRSRRRISPDWRFGGLG
jgi:hypothetical protein